MMVMLFLASPDIKL